LLEFFQRILEANGWAMAALGITMDMLCLAALAIIISRVPVIIAFIEKTGKPSAEKNSTDTGAAAADVENIELPLPGEGTHKIATVYRDCAKSLGVSFPLADLYKVCREKGLPHPHLTIKSLRESGFLVPEGEGKFKWNL